MVRQNIFDSDDSIFSQLPELLPINQSKNIPDLKNKETTSDFSKKLIMRARNKFLPAFLFSFIILVIVGFIVGRNFAEIFAISLIVAIFFATFVSFLTVNQ